MIKELTMAKDERLNNLFELSDPIMKYLQENFHPHTTVVIEWNSIRVEETLASVVKECSC